MRSTSPSAAAYSRSAASRSAGRSGRERSFAAIAPFAQNSRAADARARELAIEPLADDKVRFTRWAPEALLASPPSDLNRFAQAGCIDLELGKGVSHQVLRPLLHQGE